MDSEGLLLCTNDGAFVLAVTHPGGGVRKRYRAWVRGQPTKAGLDALVRGVGLDDGPARALTVRVLPLARATRGLRLAPWQAPAGVVAVLEVVMGEGRKREVRRLLAAVGLPVVRLVRVAVGPVTLTGLRPGQYRYLSEREVAALREPRGHPPIPERH
jgi:pseudouridine synthase